MKFIGPQWQAQASGGGSSFGTLIFPNSTSSVGDVIYGTLYDSDTYIVKPVNPIIIGQKEFAYSTNQYTSIGYLHIRADAIQGFNDNVTFNSDYAMNLFFNNIKYWNSNTDIFEFGANVVSGYKYISLHLLIHSNTGNYYNIFSIGV